MAAQEGDNSEELRAESTLKKKSHSDNCNLQPPSQWVQKEGEKVRNSNGEDESGMRLNLLQNGG